MKPISPLSLYIFLSVASAAPIVPARELCHGLCKTAPKSFLTAIFSLSFSVHKAAQNEPDVQNHQVSIDEALAKPSTSSAHPPISLPSNTFDAEVPLESSFLLNLPKTKDEKTLASSFLEIPKGTDATSIEALQSTSARVLPPLHTGGSKGLESTVHPIAKLKNPVKCSKHTQVSSEILKQEKELKFLRGKLQTALLGKPSLAVTPEEVNSYFIRLENMFSTVAISTIRNSKINKTILKIAKKEDIAHDEEYHFTARARKLSSAYDRMVGAQSRKEAVQGDVLVVGIVLLFVCAVVIVEVADLIYTSIKYLLGFTQGAIRLPNDDELVSKIRPFRLLAAPKSRKPTLEKICEEV